MDMHCARKTKTQRFGNRVKNGLRVWKEIGKYTFIFLDVAYSIPTHLPLVKSWFIRLQWRTLDFWRLTIFLVLGNESKWFRASH